MMDGEDTRPMDDREREHPDEGTIHAWLDGALDDGAAHALAAHVASCRVCAERVAEARGLIAGASRIVNALDDAPSATGPAWGQAPVAPTGPTTAATPRGWRMLRVTPARAAIAATVLVALGVSLTYERVAVDSQATRAVAERADVQSTTAAASAPAAQMAPLRRDPLLDSAVARNIAKAQPPRAVEPAPGPALPVPTAAPAGAIADVAAPARVAAGRAAMRAERETGAGAAPDQLAGRAAGGARSANDRAMATAARVDTVATRAPAAAPSPAPGSVGSVVQSQPFRVAAMPECYRVESANGVAATWGADALPLVVRVDSAGRGVVLTVAGQATGSQAVVTRAGDDSLVLRLRRIGYEGTLALGAPGDARAGVMRSRPAESRLEQMVVTATPADEPSSARRRAPVAKQAPQAAQAPAAAEARSAATAAPAVPVVARRISCPG
jgi:hypothetical protein